MGGFQIFQILLATGEYLDNVARNPLREERAPGETDDSFRGRLLKRLATADLDPKKTP